MKPKILSTENQTRLTAVTKLGLKIESTFIPYSKSRNFKPLAKPKIYTLSEFNNLSLNWKVRLIKTTHLILDGDLGDQRSIDKDRVIIETDYSAGIGHCSAYKRNARLTIDYVGSIEQEIETGKPSTEFGTFASNEIAQPDPLSVLYSLITDSEVLNYSGFDDWALEFGYDPDSRKAEKIYRDCLEIALKIQNGLGTETLNQLRELLQDY